MKKQETNADHSLHGQVPAERRLKRECFLSSVFMSNEVNPVYLAVFQSDIVATYEAKERAIEPLELRIERHLDEVGFHTHVITPYTVMKTPPWKLIIPTVCFDLCKYKKSETDPTLYRLHYSELLESFTDYTHIFTDGSKDGDKTAATFICQSFEFSKRLPDKAELEVLVSALRYIEITAKNNKFVVFSDSKSALQALLSKWDHPTVQTIMRFLVFLHTVHKTVIFCWLPSDMGISGNERADSAAKVALQKVVSECLISYTDVYQYISQYVRDLWQREWDTAVNNKLHATKPLIGEQLSAYSSVRRDEVVLSILKLGHSYLTHSYLLKGKPPPESVTCGCRLTISHILVDCIEYDFYRLILFDNNFTLTDIFNNVSPNKIISFIKRARLYNTL